MDDYISKPVRQEDLGQVLKRLLTLAETVTAAGATKSIEAPPPVDLEQLYKAFGDQSDALDEMLEIYLDQMTESLNDLDAAIKSGDAVTVNLIAHKCAGTSAYCGMTGVIAPLRELETMGRENMLTGADAVAAKVGREFERINLFLQEKLQHAAV